MPMMQKGCIKAIKEKKKAHLSHSVSECSDFININKTVELYVSR